MEIAGARRPDRSIVIASNADGLSGTRDACHRAVGGNVGQRQAAIAGPHRTSISSSDAKLVLLDMRKDHRGKRHAPQSVETGIRHHPNDALAIEQYLPDGIGTKPLFGSEA